MGPPSPTQALLLQVLQLEVVRVLQLVLPLWTRSREVLQLHLLLHPAPPLPLQLQLRPARPQQQRRRRRPPRPGRSELGSEVGS